MVTLSPQAAEYVAVWRRVLGDWLKWPEDRIVRFIMMWEEELTAPEQSRNWAILFHETPIECVSRLLQPPALRTRHIGPDDNPVEIDHKIEHAFNQDYHFDSDRFDWDAARGRVEAVLAEYGATFPRPEDLAPYEEEDKRRDG